MAGLSEVFNLDFKFGGNVEFLARLEKLMQRVDERFESVGEDISETAKATTEMSDAVDELSDSFKNGVSSLNSFGEKLKDIAQYYLSFQAIRSGAERVWSFGMESMNAYSTQERAENQLKGVMKNRGNLDRFGEIKEYAANIQGRSIYGDEAMIKAAGELATYVTGADSIKSMMSLLTDYAAGMTGGGEISPEQMESLATGLGMAYDGNYMALNRKGFDTEKLKALDAIVETGGKWGAKEKKKYGDVLSKELIDEIKRAGGVTEQMRVDALRESLKDWNGLSDAVNNLDSSALVRLNNKLGDLKENLGQKIYPTFNKLVDTVDSHMPDIEKAFNSIGEIFETIAKTIDSNLDNITGIVEVLSKLVTTIAKFPKVSVATVIALNAIASGALSAKNGFGGLSSQIQYTMKDLLNFNSVASAAIGFGIGAAGVDTAGMESKGGTGLIATGGVLGNIGLAALSGAKAFGVLGAAVAAAGATIGTVFCEILDEYNAYKDVKRSEKELSEKQSFDKELLRRQRRLEEVRKTKIQVRGKNGKWEEIYQDVEEEKALNSLKDYVSSYEARWGKGSVAKGVMISIEKGTRKDRINAKNASKNATKGVKGDINIYQDLSRTNITQNVSLASDIQKVGILLNQNIRAIIEKQMRQNREVSLSSGV